MPRLPDHRLELEPLDQDPALVVQLEVHRPDHPLAPSLPEPPFRGFEQRVKHALVVLELQEPEHPPPAVMEVVERVVDLRRDTPHHSTLAPRQEVLGLAVGEVRIQLAGKKQVALELQRRYPGRAFMQAEREPDERAQFGEAPDGPDLDRRRSARPGLHARHLGPYRRRPTTFANAFAITA